MKRQGISAIEKGDIVLICTRWQKLLGKYNKRLVVSVALVFQLLIFPGSRFANQSRSVNSRPNIVFILVDDLRWDELGIAGHPYLKTPNIDRLGREGGVADGPGDVTSEQRRERVEHRRAGGKITLSPANARLAPMDFDPADVTLYGKVVTVLRRLS